MFKAPQNWDDVVKLKPQGFVELNNRKQIVCGPFKEINFRYDPLEGYKVFKEIAIHLEWTAKRDVHLGRPISDWEVLSNVPCIAITQKIPTHTVPFILEETEYGRRIRWGINFIYLERNDILNPRDVKGFIFPDKAKELQIL